MKITVRYHFIPREELNVLKIESHPVSVTVQSSRNAHVLTHCALVLSIHTMNYHRDHTEGFLGRSAYTLQVTRNSAPRYLPKKTVQGRVRKDSWTTSFAVGLFKILLGRKQPTCLSPGEWLHSAWSIPTMQSCSAAEKQTTMHTAACTTEQKEPHAKDRIGFP